MCCHTGYNAALHDLQRRDPTPDGAMSVPMLGLTVAEAFGMWILGGIFARFPQLKVVFVEPGLGWVPWYVHYIDEMILKLGYRNPKLDELPSAYFHRNVFLTFMEDALSLQLLRHQIGIENILWATDYPHPPTTWPNSRAVIDAQFRGIPSDERFAMTAGNARRVWNLA
jgi:predicted TIM-barrel fold metal-dependent hydrolase